MPLALVKNLANVVPLVLVQNLTTRWCHQHWFKIWPKCNSISIGSNFSHQVAIFASVTNLATIFLFSMLLQEGFNIVLGKRVSSHTLKSVSQRWICRVVSNSNSASPLPGNYFGPTTNNILCLYNISFFH